MKASGQTTSSMVKVRRLIDGVADGSALGKEHDTGAAALASELAAKNECVHTSCRLLLSGRCRALRAGKCLLETGDKFDGQWREGRRHGTGSCLYASKDK